jgi:hypothetical protein
MTPRVDVSTWIGAYPFRELPHPEPSVLVERVLAREGFTGAWTGHLPGAFHRDPAASNSALFRALEAHRDRLDPAPMVRPDWPRWESTLDSALAEGVASVRVYPTQWGLGAGHPGLAELALACGERGIALHVTVRFEDLRQRHPLDSAGDVSGAQVRAVARLPRSKCHLVIAGAGRELIEEIHWGLTPDEQSRVWYDFGWVWGPPEEQFAHLVRTIGPARLAWGSFWPLRLVQQSRALVELMPENVREIAPDTAFADGASIGASARSAARSA